MFLSLLVFGAACTFFAACFHETLLRAHSSLPNGVAKCLYARFAFPGAAVSMVLDPIFLLVSLAILPLILRRLFRRLWSYWMSVVGVGFYWVLSASYLALVWGDSHPFLRWEPIVGALSLGGATWIALNVCHYRRAGQIRTALATGLVYALGTLTYYFVGFHLSDNFGVGGALAIAVCFILNAGPAFGIVAGVLLGGTHSMAGPRRWPPFLAALSLFALGALWFALAHRMYPSLAVWLFVAFAIAASGWLIRGLTARPGLRRAPVP